jgi:hypothetical protein
VILYDIWKEKSFSIGKWYDVEMNIVRRLS